MLKELFGATEETDKIQAAPFAIVNISVIILWWITFFNEWMLFSNPLAPIFAIAVFVCPPVSLFGFLFSLYKILHKSHPSVVWVISLFINLLGLFVHLLVFVYVAGPAC